MRNKTNILDLIKVVACVLIVGSHCLPLFRNDGLNYYYGQWFFRFCVPLFFVSTGYFFAKMEVARKKAYIKRIVLLYLGAANVKKKVGQCLKKTRPPALEKNQATWP